MKLKEHIVIMVPNSRTHIILVSFRMQKWKKKKKKYYTEYKVH